jgi:ethanolamine ammonia-lyase small subunit
MEYIKLVKKITDWNSIGIRTRRWPNNKWSDEVIHDLKKAELRNWIQLVKGRKVWNDLVQKTKTRVGL